MTNYTFKKNLNPANSNPKCVFKKNQNCANSF